MVPICPNFFTTPSSLGFMYDEPQVNWHQNQDLTSILDHHHHHFNLTTFGDDNYWHHHLPQPQPQPLPSNDIDLYNYNNIINNTSAILPPAVLMAGGGGTASQLALPPEAVAASTEEAMEAEKKRRLDHNASERDRRKKINSMYSSLRDVLPIINQKQKKLSNPATVAWALRYIPELQKNVHLLLQRKQKLVSSSTSKTTNNTVSTIDKYSSYSVQATNLGNGEVLVQILTPKSVKNIIPASTVMRELEEEDGVVVMEVSSSESPAGRVFHHLHLKVEASGEVCEILRVKLLSLCQRWEQFSGPAMEDKLLKP